MQGTLSYPTNSPDRVRRNALDFVGIFLGLIVVALILTTVTWQFWHASRIFTGVRVAGVPIGNMTRIEAVNHLNRKLQPYPLAPVSLTHDGQKWPLTGLTANAGTATNVNVVTTVDFVSAVNRAYLVGRDESTIQQLQDQLLALLIGINVEPAVAFNRAQLRHAISIAAVQVHQPARPSREIDGVQVPGQEGIAVDVESTLAGLMETLNTELGSSTTIEAPFVVQRVPAEPLRPDTGTNGATNGAATAAVNDSLVGGTEVDSTATLPSILLKDNNGTTIAIDAAAVDELVFSLNPLRIDQEALAARLAGWAEQVNVEPRDARLQFNPSTGTINILQTSMVGRALDIGATTQAVNQALESAMGSVNTLGDAPSIIETDLVVRSVAPAVDVNQIPQLGIRELVASGTTYFGGSSAARIRNIEVAASKFEGVVIPPGEIFSFNELVEDVSAANGFEDSLIIWGDQTAVGVGGGVCQVSTTIFRAAYEAGLPIVERYNHGYVVSWYGEPGLDATIYTPTVDFRFRNDTDAHLLVDPIVDSANGVMTFNLYGTKPNRQVIINEPVVSEIKAPEPPVYKVDEELATGIQEQVEWEKEGKTVEVTRTIIQDGEAREDTITSTYQPWQAVILVGPGTLAEPAQDGVDSE